MGGSELLQAAALENGLQAGRTGERRPTRKLQP